MERQPYTSKEVAITLREMLLQQGAALVGYADLQGTPAAHLPYGVSIAVAVPREVVLEIAGGPTERYYQTYQSLNRLLETLGGFAVTHLQEAGWQAEMLASTIRVTSENIGGAALPHKTVATCAGLGWIGRSALLVTPEYGGAVRLISVLTDMPLPCGEPVTEAKCGSCTACVQNCPGRALTGEAWQRGKPRKHLINAERCRDAARALSVQSFGVSATICGKCFESCPHTKRYLQHTV